MEYRTSGIAVWHRVLLQAPIKDPHWYDAQGSDTTMLPNAAKPGQKMDTFFYALRSFGFTVNHPPSTIDH